MPPNSPHKLTKTAEPWLGGEPPRAARTARPRHVGCSSLLPLRISRGSRRAAPGGRRGGRLLQLRVSTLGGLHESRMIARRSIAIHANKSRSANPVHGKAHVPPRSAARWGTSRDQQNAPPPKRQFGHSIREDCIFAHSRRSRVPKLSLHHPPGACSSRPVPHSPPSLARSGHPVVCHTARNSH